MELKGTFRRHPLDAIFAPRNVAVIGATEKEDSVGRTLLWNLISNPFGGTVFPVNPKRNNVMGIRAYPSISDVPDQVDLAVIVTPAPTVPGVIEECVAAGVKGAIIISAGFKEIGPEGAKLEQEILAKARAARMRIIGPNCLGVMSPLTGINATFAKGMARPGSVGFISQSGALCTSVLDWSLQENVGFSAFVSIGSMLDVDWADLIYYLGEDQRTKSIVMYMETIGDATPLPLRRARGGPGQAHHRHQGRAHQRRRQGRRLAHRLAGRQRRRARCRLPPCRRAARRPHRRDLLHGRSALQAAARPGPQPHHRHQRRRPRRAGRRRADHGRRQADRDLRRSHGGAEYASCPRAWSHGNPIDILGDASAERYAKTLELAAADKNSDGLLVILTPQDMTDPTQTAEQLRQAAPKVGKQAGAGLLDGWRRRRGRHLDPQPRRHPDLPLPGHGRAGLQLHVAVHATT